MEIWDTEKTYILDPGIVLYRILQGWNPFLRGTLLLFMWDKIRTHMNRRIKHCGNGSFYAIEQLYSTAITLQVVCGSGEVGGTTIFVGYVN